MVESVSNSPRVIPRNRMQIIELEVMARDGIEPSTRGFSVRRRARLGVSKPKTGHAFPRKRPNHPARLSLCRTGTENPGRVRLTRHVVQRLRRIATEPGPNRAPGCKASLVDLR